MDPVTAAGLIASALGVADIATRVGCGLRHLQKEFSGALESVENICQQTSTIDLAITEICRIAKQRPQTFPPSFEAHLSDSTSAVHNIVRQMQNHVESVRTTAEKSQAKAKIRHLLNSAQVAEWGSTLAVQIQALGLLLQVAQLRSRDERIAVLEKDSTRKLFEKASSMSAKLTQSSCEFRDHMKFRMFSFDSDLLETKVYRRVCESSWIRELSTTLDDGNDSSHTDSASVRSVSSNGAIASERDGESSSGSLDPLEQEPCNTMESPMPECSDSIILNPAPPTVQTSTSTSSVDMGESSSTDPTSLTLATTISTLDGSVSGTPESQRNRNLTKSSKIVVVVEEIGEDCTSLAVHMASDQYDKTQQAIQTMKDRILVNGGVDPSSYSGVCVSSTIETSGQPDVHRFPLTPEFLNYSMNKVEDGFYSDFVVLAQFASATESGNPSYVALSTRKRSDNSKMERGPINLFQIPWTTESKPRHFDIPSSEVPPFIKDVQGPAHRVDGGFSTVFRVKLHPQHHNFRPAELREHSYYAIKRLKSDRSDESTAVMFDKEFRVLKKLSESHHTHLLTLFATFHWRGHYHFVFPWADGTLNDLWKSCPTEDRLSETPYTTVRWVVEQCLGLVDALMKLHSDLTPHQDSRSSSSRDAEDEITYGRHGDLKPQNILWFVSAGNGSSKGILKLSDFGLTELHSSKDSRACPKIQGGTMTYGAPELKHRSHRQNPSSAYDIWSFGCILLEFATWYCGGWEMIERFKISRYKKTRHGTFFELDGDAIVLSSPVSRQLQLLRDGILSLDPPLPEALDVFLNITRECFEIEARDRPSAATIVSKMRSIHVDLDVQKILRQDGGSSVHKGKGMDLIRNIRGGTRAEGDGH